MFSFAELHQLYDGPIPPAALAVARFGSPEMVALVRAHGETAFFRSMVLGQLKTIRMRRADGTYYPALLDDLRLYRRQFRGWNRVAAELRRAIGGRGIHPGQTSPRSAPTLPAARDAPCPSKGAPPTPRLQHC